MKLVSKEHVENFMVFLDNFGWKNFLLRKSTATHTHPLFKISLSNKVIIWEYQKIVEYFLRQFFICLNRNFLYVNGLILMELIFFSSHSHSLSLSHPHNLLNKCTVIKPDIIIYFLSSWQKHWGKEKKEVYKSNTRDCWCRKKINTL